MTASYRRNDYGGQAPLSGNCPGARTVGRQVHGGIDGSSRATLRPTSNPMPTSDAVVTLEARRPAHEPPRDIVFISHASDDEWAAHLARSGLRDAGQDSYLAVVDTGRALSMPAALLDDVLVRCDRILVLWSRSAANAPWVAAEWRAFYELRGAERCEVIALDGTPFPGDVGGTVVEAPPDWKHSGRRHSTPHLAPPPARSLLYVTRSPGGEAIAEAVCGEAAKLGFEVRPAWQPSSALGAGATTNESGDWVLVAADPARPPEGWEGAFGDDPNRYPRRLVLRASEGRVPLLLQISRHISGDDRDALTAWLMLPSLDDCLRLLSLRPDPWTRLARRLHDGLAPDFSWIDLRLRYVDRRLRRGLEKLRASVLGAAVLAHLLCGTLTFVLPLCSPSTTRRHLVLSATMVLFASIAVELASFAAAVGVATYGGILGAAAVLVAGFWTRAGMPGVGFGVGLILAIVAATDVALASGSKRLQNRPDRAALAALLAVGAVAIAVLAGGVGLLHAGDLNHLAPVPRVLWGVLFGLIGGGTVGGALGLLRLHLLRRRETGKAASLALWGALAGMPITALATMYSTGNADDLLDGLGIGLFCGALAVGLVVMPTAAMRRYTDAKWLPFASCGLAIVVAGLLALLFPHAGLRQLLIPFVSFGFLFGCALFLPPFSQMKSKAGGA